MNEKLQSLILNRLPPETSPIPHSPIEESNQLSSSLIMDDSPATNNSTFDLTDIHQEKLSNTETSNNIQCLSNNKSSVILSNLSSEPNDSIDQFNSSLFLQKKQHRIDHRRNKSEPFKSASIDNIPSEQIFDLSSTKNTIPISNHATDQIKRKSSTKLNISPLKNVKSQTNDKPSSLSTTSRKKKPWYNVSIFFCCYFDDSLI